MPADTPSSVLLAGGGTAGHVSPLLALADCLRRRDPDISVTALGTEAGLEARLVPERGYPLLTVPKVPLPRKPSGDLLRLPGNLRAAVAAAEQAIEQTGAQVVVGFGGYVSTPAYLAARRRKLPVVVHEQNARAGLANRLGARMTPFVATTFASTKLAHATAIGMPLRREITQLDRVATPPGGARPLRSRPAVADRPGHRRIAGRATPQHRLRGPRGRAAGVGGAGPAPHRGGQGVRGPHRWSRAPPTSSRPTPTAWTSPMPRPTSWSRAPVPTRSAS